MKIALIGGAGFIATNVALEAINRGHQVVAFDNLCRNGVENNMLYMKKRNGLNYSFVWGDVRKAGDFDAIGKVDAIINLAANPSVVRSIAEPIMDFETNAVGTLHSLEYARKLGNIPYIYASTNKTFTDITNEINLYETDHKYMWGKVKNVPHREVMWTGLDFDKEGNVVAVNDKFTVDGFGKYGHSNYGVSKLSGEMLCQEYHIQYGIPFTAFKMSCIYGLFQKGVETQAWIDWFIRQIVFGNGELNIYGTGKQVRDVLDGRDTARAYLDALENMDKCNGEIFTLGGGPDLAYSLLETIDVIEEISGKEAKLTFHDKRPSDQDIYISSIKKVKKILGWKPKISLEQSIKDMIKQYKKDL